MHAWELSYAVQPYFGYSKNSGVLTALGLSLTNSLRIPSFFSLKVNHLNSLYNTGAQHYLIIWCPADQTWIIMRAHKYSCFIKMVRIKSFLIPKCKSYQHLNGLVLCSIEKKDEMTQEKILRKQDKRWQDNIQSQGQGHITVCIRDALKHENYKGWKSGRRRRRQKQLIDDVIQSFRNQWSLEIKR